MKRMRGRVLLPAAACVALLAGLFVPATATAQHRGDSYEWSVFAGQNIFDSDLDLRDAFYYGTRFGINFTDMYELEVSGAWADSTRTRDPFQGDADWMDLGLNFMWNFPAKSDRYWRFAPYVGLGVGYTSLDLNDRLSEDDTTLNLNAGFRWFGTEKIALRVEGKAIGDTDSDWTNFAVTAGLSFVSGGELRDSDGDTVPDTPDDCPNTPMGCIVDPRGCELDGDEDGICDGLDQCPNTRTSCQVNTSGCDLDEDGDGVCTGMDQCPDTPSGCRVNASGCSLDSDGDGVCDGNDRCSGTPSGCRVDSSGCPLDGDGDGVCDGNDACPNTRQGCRVDARGCAMDSDGDGVCDGIDECPGTPRGAQVDSVGCEMELRINNVQFDLNKADIKAEFVPILQKVAKAMRDNSRMQILLSGHTDSLNTEQYNLRLAARRADAVKQWLVREGGVDASRIETEGLGECCPIADNTTSEGRYRNRRVEFKRTR